MRRASQLLMLSLAGLMMITSAPAEAGKDKNKDKQDQIVMAAGTQTGGAAQSDQTSQQKSQSDQHAPKKGKRKGKCKDRQGNKAEC